ncbi:MAG: hypothetical protein JXQ96_09450 [Cyclobacteriaceae bacterium]
MIKRLILYVILFTTLTAADVPRVEYKLREFSTIDFSNDGYDSSTIYFYHLLIDKENFDNRASEQFVNLCLPLDIYDYWLLKKDEKYDIFLTKTAYVLDAPVKYFTEERLSSVEYIRATMPEAKVEKQDSTYHVVVGFGSPDIDYSLRFYSNNSFIQEFNSLGTYFKSYDGMRQDPNLVVLQHNFNYGRVMFQKTSKMSISISRYFDISGRTLVLNYTLNYIHNMPPGFIGGSEFLIEKIKKGIKALIEETSIICNSP